MRSLTLPILLSLTLLIGGLATLPAHAVEPSPAQPQVAVVLSYTGDLSELNAYLGRGWTAVCSISFAPGANNGIRAVVILAPPVVAPPKSPTTDSTVLILPYEQRLAALNKLRESVYHDSDWNTSLLARSFTPIIVP